MATPTNDKLAVLIDADNAQASVIHELLEEVARYGTASVKRAYGDWTTPRLAGWKDVLHKQAIQPIQQFSYTTGKNATDSALIIDAMDLLHAGGLNGFCLVSSDSDFTRLATRIREAGLMVYGFGQEKTPDPFVAACDKFIFTEILKPEKASATNSEEAKPTKAKKSVEPMMRRAVTAAAATRDDGWASLSGVGNWLLKSSPSFDPRNYGFPKLSDLVRAQSYLEVKRPAEGEGNPQILVRIKGNV